MKLTLLFALAALLSSCAQFSPNTTSSHRAITGADAFAPYGGQEDTGGGLFSGGAGSEDPNAAFQRRKGARYGTLFMAETKPWMVGSVQEQYPKRHALPGSGWKGSRPPAMPYMDDYSMGSGAPASYSGK